MKIELQNVNTNKLHDELIKANIIPSLIESKDNTTWIIVDDSQESAVMAVVASHNPSPLPSPKTDGEKLKERVSATEEAINFILGL